jgi:hypothetical protein
LAELKSEYSQEDYDMFLDNMVEIRTSFRKQDLVGFTEKLNFIKAMLTRDNPNLRLAFDQFFPMTNPIVARSILEQRISEESRLQYDQWFEYYMNQMDRKRAEEQELERQLQINETAQGADVVDVTVQRIHHVAMMQRLAQQQRLEANGSPGSVLPSPVCASSLPFSSQINALHSRMYARPVRVAGGGLGEGTERSGPSPRKRKGAPSDGGTGAGGDVKRRWGEYLASTKRARVGEGEGSSEGRKATPSARQIVDGVFSAISGLPRASSLSASLAPVEIEPDPLASLPFPRHPRVSLVSLVKALPPGSLMIPTVGDGLGSAGDGSDDEHIARTKQGQEGTGGAWERGGVVSSESCTPVVNAWSRVATVPVRARTGETTTAQPAVESALSFNGASGGASGGAVRAVSGLVEEVQGMGAATQSQSSASSATESSTESSSEGLTAAVAAAKDFLSMVTGEEESGSDGSIAANTDASPIDPSSNVPLH